ncbi:hypothetical protein LINPERHAP2_LOCUS33603 [Linum perenne]
MVRHHCPQVAVSLLWFTKLKSKGFIWFDKEVWWLILLTGCMTCHYGSRTIALATFGQMKCPIKYLDWFLGYDRMNIFYIPQSTMLVSLVNPPVLVGSLCYETNNSQK